MKASIASSSLSGLLCTACAINPSASSAVRRRKKRGSVSTTRAAGGASEELTLVDVSQGPSQEHDDVCVVERCSVVGGFGSVDDLDDIILDGFGDGLCRRQAVSERFQGLDKLSLR